jgi:hypothetical protein
MSSEGTGVGIGFDEAMLILHKLMTESTKVQASFEGPGHVNASVSGTVEIDETGRVFVRAGREPGASFLAFDPNEAASCKYADTVSRGAPPRFSPPRGGPLLSSVLCFVFPGKESVCLFEVVE